VACDQCIFSLFSSASAAPFCAQVLEAQGDLAGAAAVLEAADALDWEVGHARLASICDPTIHTRVKLCCNSKRADC